MQTEAQREADILVKVNNNDFPDHLFGELYIDVDKVAAYKSMKKHDEDMLVDLLLDGDTLGEVFEQFMQCNQTFKNQYRSELFEIVSDWMDLE